MTYKPRLAVSNDEQPTKLKTQPAPAQESGKATPLYWRPMSVLAPRKWLYGHDFIEKFVTVTVAAGGSGKTLLTVTEALAMASGRNLLGAEPVRALRVWMFNGEDPVDEMERRILAAASHYGIEYADIKGRLFVDAGQNRSFSIVKNSPDGINLNKPVFNALAAEIRSKGIDVLIIDPFIAFHQANENDNVAINMVAKAFSRLADQTRCAVHLIHHSRKTFGNEATIEDARGASALMAAARVGRILNVMTKDEADRAGLSSNRSHFRMGYGKASLSKPPAEAATWFEIRSVDLHNGVGGSSGDSVGVVMRWAWTVGGTEVTPDQVEAVHAAMVGSEWRESSQAANWVGRAVADAFGLKLDEDGVRKAKSLVKQLLVGGHLGKAEGLDAKRMKRTFIVPATPSKSVVGQREASGAPD